MGKLDNKIAIVTGGARGLGEGIARRFAEEGATVVVADRADATEMAAGLPVGAGGRPSEAVRLDVTDRAGVEELISRIVRDYGRLDILVNNAGICEVSELIDSSDDLYQRTFGINTYGVFLASRAAGRVMREQRSGRIISISSQLGKIARRRMGLYSASKASVILMMQAFALELGPYGVTANSICPGSMITPMLTTAEDEPGIEYAARMGVDVDTAFADYIRTRVPVGRLGRAEDVGGMATYLASDDGAFVTGAALNLTGGEQIFF